MPVRRGTALGGGLDRELGAAASQAVPHHPYGFNVDGFGLLSGVFAVGDGRRGSVKRVGSAIGEGAQVVAVLFGICPRRRVLARRAQQRSCARPAQEPDARERRQQSRSLARVRRAIRRIAVGSISCVPSALHAEASFGRQLWRLRRRSGTPASSPRWSCIRRSRTRCRCRRTASSRASPGRDPCTRRCRSRRGGVAGPARNLYKASCCSCIGCACRTSRSAHPRSRPAKLSRTRRTSCPWSSTCRTCPGPAPPEIEQRRSRPRRAPPSPSAAPRAYPKDLQRARAAHEGRGLRRRPDEFVGTRFYVLNQSRPGEFDPRAPRAHPRRRQAEAVA